MEESDFGRGLVICLMKFSEHFSNRFARQLRNINLFLGKTEAQQRMMLSSNPPPNLNYGRREHDDMRFFVDHTVSIYGSVEKALSQQINLWANGASDHLYEIMVPKRWEGTELHKKVLELQDLGLKIGHGFTGDIWTMEHFDKLWSLTRECIVLIDQMIGLKRQADLGQW